MMYKSHYYWKFAKDELGIPAQGWIVPFGINTNISNAFDDMLHYDRDRVKGYDIDTKHSNIVNCDLNNVDNIDVDQVAYADIDVGDYSTHLDIRHNLLYWCCSHMVQGGIILFASPKVTGYRIAQHMIAQGFEHLALEDFSTHPALMPVALGQCKDPMKPEYTHTLDLASMYRKL